MLRARGGRPGARSRLPVAAGAEPAAGRARASCELAIERMRFVLGVDDDLGEFHRRFRRDPLLGPLIRRMPGFRPRRRRLALGGAGRGGGRAADRGRARGRDRAPHRRPLGAAAGRGAGGAARRPGAAAIAGRAPAELAVDGPAPARAGGAAAGRRARSPPAAADRRPPAADRRLLAIPQIGPWTVQCLGLFGRGEMDSLPAGDLGYIKLVGRLAGLGRRATVAEVEEFYAPYEPFRGLVGALTLAGLHRLVAQGPPLRLAA